MPCILESAGLGLKIGTVYIGSPICADDTLLLSTNAFEFQGMLDICYGHSISHYYDLHKKKSVAVTMLKRTDPRTNLHFLLYIYLAPIVVSLHAKFQLISFCFHFTVTV